jgi:hypothetical protein
MTRELIIYETLGEIRAVSRRLSPAGQAAVRIFTPRLSQNRILIERPEMFATEHMACIAEGVRTCEVDERDPDFAPRVLRKLDQEGWDIASASVSHVAWANKMGGMAKKGLKAAALLGAGTLFGVWLG